MGPPSGAVFKIYSAVTVKYDQAKSYKSAPDITAKGKEKAVRHQKTYNATK